MTSEERKKVLDISREYTISQQRKLCKDNKWPMFMPNSGYCWDCNADFTDKSKIRLDITKSHVTYCPACGKSYCD